MREWPKHRGGKAPIGVKIKWFPDKLVLVAELAPHGPGKVVGLESSDQHWVEARR
jgi:hypothetical protein